jgi:hypothetical protein
MIDIADILIQELVFGFLDNRLNIQYPPYQRTDQIIMANIQLNVIDLNTYDRMLERIKVLVSIPIEEMFKAMPPQNGDTKYTCSFVYQFASSPECIDEIIERLKKDCVHLPLVFGIEDGMITTTRWCGFEMDVYTTNGALTIT